MWRGSSEFTQEYAHGRPLGTLTESPVATSNGTRAPEHGTRISFRYDQSVFASDAAYDADVVGKRLRELAFLNAAAALKYDRTEKGVTKSEEFRYEGGIAEYVQQLVEGTETLHDCIHFSRTSDSCDVCAPKPAEIDFVISMKRRSVRIGAGVGQGGQMRVRCVRASSDQLRAIAATPRACVRKALSAHASRRMRRSRWRCSGRTRARRRSSAL